MVTNLINLVTTSNYNTSGIILPHDHIWINNFLYKIIISEMLNIEHKTSCLSAYLCYNTINRQFPQATNNTTHDAVCEYHLKKKQMPPT